MEVAGALIPGSKLLVLAGLRGATWGSLPAAGHNILEAGVSGVPVKT
jgi:hypothetical protein